MNTARSSFSFYSLQGVWLLLLTYGLIHGSMRLGGSWNLGENDPATVIYTQSLAMLFSSSEGVLFDFAFFVLSKVLGVNALTFQILRYGLLALSLVYVYLIVRRISGPGLWPIVTVEAYALIYQLSWRLHEGFTYPLVTMVMVAATFWYFSALRERWSSSRLIVFVLAVGAGATTGLWYMGFLVSLFIALLFRRSIERWLTIQIILALGVLASFGDILALGFTTDDLVFSDGPVSGFYEAALLMFAASSPFLILVVLFFGWRIHKKSENGQELLSLIKYSSLISFFGILIIGLFLKLEVFGEHAVVPLFFLFPIWLMDVARRTQPNWWQVRAFMVICLILMMVAFGIRAANLYVLDPVCKRCYFGVPYQQLAKDLADKFPIMDDTLVIATDIRLVGQLAAFWPNSMPWFSTKFPDGKRPGLAKSVDTSPAGQKYLIVWNEVRGDAAIRDLLLHGGMPPTEVDAVIADAQTMSVGWRHWWRETGYRQTVWKASFITR